ncbi:unnamed protein product [Rotaria sordida]|uniref:Uncharacterized protein n=1 Tax=Rotaria sordida TaxID=392033 RepID=A0A819GRK1_9BILA|nr:unnamed protein product [Rotaria sordida]CAF3890859.1 unnamed protein product [Rotaria sordida]CAF3931166.1 unnamed protein product [Rotaria sordida]
MKSFSNVVKITKYLTVIIVCIICNYATNTIHADILKRNNTHTASCNPDPIKITLRKFHENIVDRANSTQKSTGNVLSQCLTQLLDASFENLNIHREVVKNPVKSVIFSDPCLFNMFSMRT